MYKETLSKDLLKFEQVGSFTQIMARRTVGIGTAVLFLAGVWRAVRAVTECLDNPAFIIAAGIIGG